MKPDGYPLPWCEAVDMPYWAINSMLIDRKCGWAEFQANRPMAEIIPEIDKLLAAPHEG